MAQHFEQPAETLTGADLALRAQRMTADEARAVIALWQSERVEQTGLTDKPAVPDVAEGLEVSAEDVQRLLTEVRTRRVEEERTLATERELSKIRQAEEKRQWAELQRQRAEMMREQAEWERRRQKSTDYEPSAFYTNQPAEYSTVSSNLSVAIILLVALVLIILIAVFVKASPSGV